MKSRIIQAVSWLIVLGIFAYVLGSIAPEEQAKDLTWWGRIAFAVSMMREAVATAEFGKVVTLGLVYLVYLILLDTAGTWWAICRFNTPVRFREMIPARAITFLIAALNYQAGQAALPIYLKRSHKVPLMEGTGTIFFLAALDLFAVFLMAFAGSMFVSESDLRGKILGVASLGIVFYIGHAFFWRSEKLHNFFARPLARLWPIFHAFRSARFKDYVLLFALRIPIHAAILITLYLLIQFFHAHVPFTAILIYMPVIMVASTVPIINVGSVGASQALVVHFFRAYAPEATLLAVALVWALLLNLLKVAVGALYLTRYSRDLFTPEPQAT